MLPFALAKHGSIIMPVPYYARSDALAENEKNRMKSIIYQSIVLLSRLKEFAALSRGCNSENSVVRNDNNNLVYLVHVVQVVSSSSTIGYC